MMSSFNNCVAPMRKSLRYSPDVLADSYIVPQCDAVPGSLGALMALYEGNFIKFSALVPRLRALRAGCSGLSRTRQDFDLHLWVDAVTRHTLDARLTYVFAASRDSPECDPDLQLRVYLDARMVEVVSWAGAHRHDLLRQLACARNRELDRRWSRNIMLGKWLDYLADRQHHFPL